jgi:hypothetical protein
MSKSRLKRLVSQSGKTADEIMFQHGYLTISESAKRVCVNYYTIRGLVERGIIEHVTHGHRKYIPVISLVEHYNAPPIVARIMEGISNADSSE